MSKEVHATLSREEHQYATLLWYLSRCSIILLILGFVLYSSNILPKYIPLEKVNHLLTLRANDISNHMNIPRGWQWIHYYAYGDGIAHLVIIYLSVITIACYLSIVPAILKERDIPYIIIIFLQLAVFFLSTFGNVGGH